MSLRRSVGKFGILATASSTNEKKGHRYPLHTSRQCFSTKVGLQACSLKGRHHEASRKSKPEHHGGVIVDDNFYYISEHQRFRSTFERRKLVGVE